MNGEPDFELYTISLIRLNTAFEKLETDEKEALEMIKKSSDDFEELYKDILNDLEKDEILIADYYSFFENGKTVFPMYIEALRELDVNDESVDSLINTFTNLNKIAQAFDRN